MKKYNQPTASYSGNEQPQVSLNIDGECQACGASAEVVYKDTKYCQKCAKKMLDMTIKPEIIEVPTQQSEITHESTDYLIDLEQQTDNLALKTSLRSFLDKHAVELTRKGDTWVARRVAGFIKDTETARMRPEVPLQSSWFTLTAGQENLGQKFTDTQELLEVLGYQESGVTQGDDSAVIHYHSQIFPMLVLARQDTNDGKRISYIVGKRTLQTVQ